MTESPGRGENHGDRRNCPPGAGQHTVSWNVAARLGTVSSVPRFSQLSAWMEHTCENLRLTSVCPPSIRESECSPAHRDASWPGSRLRPRPLPGRVRKHIGRKIAAGAGDQITRNRGLDVDLGLHQTRQPERHAGRRAGTSTAPAARAAPATRLNLTCSPPLRYSGFFTVEVRRP
jgi:hypothetical protein